MVQKEHCTQYSYNVPGGFRSVSEGWRDSAEGTGEVTHFVWRTLLHTTNAGEKGISSEDIFRLLHLYAFNFFIETFL